VQTRRLAASLNASTGSVTRTEVRYFCANPSAFRRFFPKKC